MAPGSPELRLNVSFDIDHFKRVALQGLVNAASKTKLDIGVQFNRDDIASEMVSLGRQLGQRKYRVDFEIKNIQTALADVGKLSKALDALNKKTSAVRAPSQSSAAAAPSGGGTIAKSRFDSPVISTGQVAAIYKAAADASLLEFNKAIVGNKRAMAAELSTVAKESIAGLVNALAAGKGQVGDAFANIGAEGLKRIKDRLGIQSPSKEMEQIGIWAGKGYQLGFVKSLEEANLAAAAVIGKSLRRMDGMVSARQRASRQFAPGEDINPKKIGDLENKLQSLRNSYKAIVDESKKSGPISYEKLRELNEEFKRINSQIARTESLLGKLRTAGPNVPFLRTQQRLGTALGQREQLQTAAQIPQLRAAAGTYSEGSLQNINKLLQSAQLLAAELVPNTKEWGQAQSEIARLNHELRRSGELANKIQLQHDFARAAKGSIAQLETKLQLLKTIARDISPDEARWNRINKKIEQTERLVEKANRKPLTGRERAGAAGGAFLYGGGMGGGAGSALGGIAGGIAGGVPGAFAGAAVGQMADSALAGAAAMAKQYSELQKMQRGLAIASIDAKDFAEAQGLVASISTRLLLPLADASKYYAQLRINTKQYNISAKDTSEILEGTVNAVRATGGSLEDVDGAMRAVVQIFSKGGVQAEELRGQLGERFPGAVIKFAQANKITFEELQKRLEAGTVGIAEFVAFSKSNFTDYAEFSKKLATAPEYAGDRMKIALEQLQLTIGSILGNSGATFQDYFTGIIKDVTKFIADNKVSFKQMLEDFAYITTAIGKLFFKLSEVVLKIMAGIAKASQVVIKGVKSALGMKDILEVSKNIKETEERIEGGGLDSKQSAMLNTQLAKDRQRFKALGGQAALDQLNGKQTDLTFGGAGANMPMTREPKDDDAKGAEAFAKLQDDLAKTYNDAEIARIKQRHELRKQLQQDEFDMQEYGANRLQKQNLALIRGLIGAEMARAETVRNAQLDVQKQSGKVAGGAGSTGAIFGDTGRTFNAKGFVHGHFQNQDREALVKDTVETVMSLLSKGVSPELGSGARFTSGMNAKQVEALVRQGIGSHKKYAGGASAVDIFVPKGTQVPVPVSGIQNLGGAAGVTGSLARGSQLMHLDKASTMRGAGAITKVTGDQKRDVLAQANTAIAMGVAQQAALDASIIKSSSAMREFARYAAEAYNIPDLKLSNELLKLRNDLTEQGMAPEVIDYQVRLYELDAQRKDLLADFPKKINGITLSEDARKAGMAALAAYLDKAKIAEKEKNDETLRGLRIAKLATLNDQLAMAGALTPDEERRLRIQQENPNQTAEFQNQLFSLEKQVEAAQKYKEQMVGIASSIGTSFGDAFKGIITGSMTAQEALAGFFQSLSNYFADMVSKMIADWLRVEAINGLKSLLGIPGGSGFSFTGDSGFGAAAFGSGFQVPGFGFTNGGIATGGFRAFATGGIVTGPTLGLVGEGRYNEAVIPLPDGKSVPVDLGGMSSGMSGAPITVNVSVDAKGSEVQGDNAQGAALGRAIAASVQSELIKQKRPGGLLAK